MLDQHHYWSEYSRLVDVFRRVGKLGGKASLTASTEGGLWKASLEIQTSPVSAAQPGPAAPSTAKPAAPGQEDAAGRRRSRRRRGPASAIRSRARARAHQATLAARRQGTCQTPATRVQAAPPPPPPPPPPQSSSARLIKVVKKPIGSQFSFSNLDGARASIASDDRLSISLERQEEVEVDEEEGTVSFPAASPERPHATPWTEDEKPGWNESYDEWVIGCWGNSPPTDDDMLRAMWKEWRRQMKEEKEKEEKEEKNESTDPTSMLGSSRNPTDSEVTTEPINENRCQRPLQRARERREARLKKESDAHAELDPHAGQQRSSLSSAQEQDCVHPQSSSESLPHDPAVEGWKPGETYSAGDEVPADVGRACWACNAYGADVEWHQHEGIAMCRRCVDDYRTSESGRSLLLQLKVGYEERQNSQ